MNKFFALVVASLLFASCTPNPAPEVKPQSESSVAVAETVPPPYGDIVESPVEYIVSPTDEQIATLYTTTWEIDADGTIESPLNAEFDAEKLKLMAWLYGTQREKRVYFKDAGIVWFSEKDTEKHLEELPLSTENWTEKIRIIDAERWLYRTEGGEWLVFRPVSL